jgi:hypothetical protein
MATTCGVKANVDGRSPKMTGMSRQRIAWEVGRGAASGLSDRPRRRTMGVMVRTLVDRLRHSLRARRLAPEEALRRREDRRAAEARMRAEIDRAVRLFGRTSRHIR